MKITISPSEDQSTEKYPYFSVSVEHPSDDSCTAEVLVAMFFQCLLATGISAEIAQKTLNEYTP